MYFRNDGKSFGLDNAAKPCVYCIYEKVIVNEILKETVNKAR